MADPALADISTFNVRKRDGGEKAPSLLPALTVVSHPVVHRAGERLVLDALARGAEVALSRNAPDFLRPGRVLGAPLADPGLSRKPLVFAPAGNGGVQLRIGSGGSPVVAGQPLQEGHVFNPEELALGVPLELGERVVLLLHLVPAGREEASDALGMVGTSAGLRRVREDILQVADLLVPVLIRGETGSGKELVARAIHEHSPRRDKPFVSVNLGAIPKELAAAELFGAQKGAYTGADRGREGFFRAARGGTLFLDEVGEAPPEVQVMLLRVLETGEMYPVGGHTPLATDVRLLAATDAHLEERIREGLFKAPLLHRLASYEVRVPPLRERREDIGPLFHHFAREQLESLGELYRLAPENPYAEPWLPAPLAARLLRFPWPGNIRQLRNLTRQLIIGSRGHPRLRLDPRLEQELEATAASHLPPVPPPQPSREEKAPPRRKPSELTEQELLTAMRECAWDFQATADRLGIPRPSLYDLVGKHPRIRTAGALTPEEIVRCFRECQGDVDAMVQRLEVSKRALTRRIKELGLTSGGG